MGSTFTKELLLMAKHTRVRANEEYWETIKLAKADGWTNVEIARVLGCTEAAIRMYFRRHPNDRVKEVAHG